MSAALRLAVVGCGDIAGFTAWFARANPRIRLAACCDRDLERAAAFARRHRIPRAYGEYSEMLAAGGLDAVYLAVPHDLHWPMAAEAIHRGLAVLLEKPLAARLAEGVELANLVETTSARLAVNYQYRYDAACYAMASAARAGEIGQVLYARCNLPWRRSADYFASGAGWHALRARSGGGTLLTQASHFIDLLLWACASPAVRAQGLTRNIRFRDAQVEVEDLAMGSIELQNGALIQVCSSMAANPERPATMDIYGENGTLHYTAGMIPMLKSSGASIHRAAPPVAGIHALARSLEAFRRCAQTGQPHLVTAAEALKTLAAVDAFYRSAASGQWEDVTG